MTRPAYFNQAFLGMVRQPMRVGPMPEVDSRDLVRGHFVNNDLRWSPVEVPVAGPRRQFPCPRCEGTTMLHKGFVWICMECAALGDFLALAECRELDRPARRRRTGAR